jgi:anti-sigma B factor antagonist
MQIRVAQEDNVSTLILEGEIDLHASPALRDELQRLAGEKTPRLLIDFSGVEYIDSSGLATLIEYVRKIAEFDGRLALFGLKPKVRIVFELVKLNELFRLVPDRDSALAAVL